MNVATRALIRSAGVRTVVRSPFRHGPGVSLVLPSRKARTYSTSGPSLNRLENLVESLKTSKDLQSIHSSCSALATAIKQSSIDTATEPSSDDDERYLSILQILATSGQPEDMRRIEEILTDLYLILGMKPSKTVYTSILQSLADAHHEQQARDFLLKIPTLPGHFFPDIELLHMVLEECSQLSLFNDLVADMQRLNFLNPTSQTFPIVFRTRLNISMRRKEAPSLAEMTKLIEQCIQLGLPYDPVVADLLDETYATLDHIEEASTIVETYQSLIRASKDGSQDDDVLSNQDLRAEKSPASVHSILRNCNTHADLLEKAKEHGLKLDTSHYSTVLKNCIDSANVEEALHIYDQALQVNVIPLHTLLPPFLKALIESPDGHQHFHDAHTLCRRLADAIATDSSPTANPDRRETPALSVYHTLIRTLTASADVARWTPVISDLMKEMKARGLPTTTRLANATTVILEMRRTGSFEDSMDTYRKHRPFLGEYGFTCVLKEYCRISFAGDLEVPLITEFFSIVNDMRLALVPVKPIVYTMFLHSIGTSATRVYRQGDPAQVHERLVATTRRVHDFLTLDASISPDPALWNQLMNTYQRLGCFAEACRLWDTMYLTGRYDQITVSIMLDACGYYPDLRQARSVLAKLRRDGFKLDLRNWNTWIECLCRCERFNEAADVILFEMAKHRMKPDLESIRIMLKFMRKTESTVQMQDIRRRIEAFAPHLWQRLQNEIPKS